MLADIHGHFLYGMDDGAQSFAESAQMIDMAVCQRIDVLVATPHAYPGVRQFSRTVMDERIAQVREYCAEKGYAVRIVEGAEIRHSDAAIRLLDMGQLPMIGNSGFVLVEWRPDASVDEIRSSVRAYSNAGYRVIMAHAERYRTLWGRYREIEHMKQAFDMRVQVNCDAFVERKPMLERLFVRRMMERELIDYVASDAHSTKGRCMMLEKAHRAIESSFGIDAARSLCGENQRELV